MLELIFQGFLEWIYGLILECWEYFSTALLDIMGLDFAYLQTHVPVINDLMQVLLAVGWAMLIGNLVFQAVKSMLSGLGFEGEDPKLLFARTFVFAFLLLASPQICRIGLDITSKVMTTLEIPDAVDVTLVDESIFGGLTASWLLVIICGLIIMFKIFRLILEIAERYVILAMLTITAPMAFAMGGSRSTAQIFTGWCRMFGSMCVLMALNVVFFKILLSVLSTIPSGLDVLPWMILILAVVKVARKADAIVTRIGLNPAITGDDLGVRLPGALTYMVIRGMTSQVTKAVGRSAGGGSRGTSPNAPPGGGGGGPHGPGPAGSGNGPGVSAAGYTHQNSQQNVAQESSHQQGAAQQNTTQQNGAAQPVGGEQSTVVGSVSSQTSPAGATAQQSRKSAVPPGTRRAPSHIRTGASPVLGVQMPGEMHREPGQTPGSVQPGGAAQTAARQVHHPNPQGVPGKPSGNHFGTAGTGSGSASRFTHSATQTVRGGDISGSVQAAEQNSISVGQQERTSVQPPPASSSHSSGTAGGHIPGEAAHHQIVSGQTRFTHRERSVEHRGQAAPASVPPPASVSPVGFQTGTAGMEASHFSERPGDQPRSGRNTSPGAPVSTEPQTSGPARQEPRRVSTPTAPSIGGTVSSQHPGTAGTTAPGYRARQAAGTQGRQGSSTATATDRLGGTRAESIGVAAGTGPMAPKGTEADTLNRTARSSKQKRGPDHG